MKSTIYLLFISVLFLCTTSCSKEEDDNKKPIGVITTNGIDLTIAKAGCKVNDTIIVMQFTLTDPQAESGESVVELQLPTSFIGEEYTLTEDNSGWRIILHNAYIGYSTDMSLIESGTIFIKPIGEINEHNKRRYKVIFEITQTDGTVTSANLEEEFINDYLWYGGR